MIEEIAFVNVWTLVVHTYILMVHILFLCVLQSWIHEKAKIIESTEELGNDLTGVMTLQRRLSGMERDLAAIQAKVGNTKLVYEPKCQKRSRTAKAHIGLFINTI